MTKNEPKHVYAEKKIKEAIRAFDIDERIPGERVFARELGISYMTIRKAVENLVAEGVLYKVAKRGTYVADPMKTRKKTKNIGYFLDSSIKDGISSPYYSMIFDALEKEAQDNGFALMYFSNMSEADLLKSMKKIDGAIFSCFPRIENIVSEIRKEMHVVCIDNSPADKSIPSVVIDNFNAVVESIKYLCSLGHERIGFITGLDDSDIGRNRLAGYLSALSSNGISEDKELIFKGDYTFKTGIKGADHLLSLDNRPTAIMCANDTMAIGAIKEISQRGLSVPDDVSVIGFDDIRVASHMTPSLTTISAPVTDIARYSIDILCSMISGKNMDNRHITLPGQFKPRETCASISPYHDKLLHAGDELRS